MLIKYTWHQWPSLSLELCKLCQLCHHYSCIVFIVRYIYIYVFVHMLLCCVLTWYCMGDTSLRLAGLPMMPPSPWLEVPLCPFCALVLVTKLPLVVFVSRMRVNSICIHCGRHTNANETPFQADVRKAIHPKCRINIVTSDDVFFCVCVLFVLCSADGDDGIYKKREEQKKIILLLAYIQIYTPSWPIFVFFCDDVMFFAVSHAACLFGFRNLVYGPMLWDKWYKYPEIINDAAIKKREKKKKTEKK